MADLEKIRRLIELAASSNEHEARNAAVMACRLIREGDIQLTEKGDIRVVPNVFVDVPMRQGSLSQDELLEELRDMGVKVGTKPRR